MSKPNYNPWEADEELKRQELLKKKANEMAELLRKIYELCAENPYKDCVITPGIYTDLEKMMKELGG